MSIYSKFLGVKPVDDERSKMIKAIEEARMEWKKAESSFNEMVDEEMLDHAIYESIAAKTKYSYLISKAKQMGLK